MLDQVEGVEDPDSSGLPPAEDVASRYPHPPDDIRQLPQWIQDNPDAVAMIAGTFTGPGPMKAYHDNPDAVAMIAGTFTGPGPMKAYHGSPYDFERFDSSRD